MEKIQIYEFIQGVKALFNDRTRWGVNYDEEDKVIEIHDYIDMSPSLNDKILKKIINLAEKNNISFEIDFKHGWEGMHALAMRLL